MESVLEINRLFIYHYYSFIEKDRNIILDPNCGALFLYIIIIKIINSMRLCGGCIHRKIPISFCLNTKKATIKTKLAMDISVFVTFGVVLLQKLQMTNQKPIIIMNVPSYVTKIITCGAGFGCKNENIAKDRSYVDCNINISDCSFSRTMTYSVSGGVIFVNGGAYSMSVNFSMFYYCSTSEEGGAIFFYSSNSFLKKNCASNCYVGTNRYYSFAYLLASQSNIVEYLSVSFCSNTHVGDSSVSLQLGNQRVDNTNSSFNKAYSVSSIFFQNPSSLTSSHCTISNNFASHSICLKFNFASGTISSANIIRNDSTYNVIICVSGTTGAPKLKYCIFQSNIKTLFYVSSGSLEVSHSFIDHSPTLSFSSRTSVSTAINNTLTKIETYQIEFFSSFHCNTDVHPPQRTNNQSPMRSFEETIKITIQETMKMTMGNTHCSTNDVQKDTPHRSYDELLCSGQMNNGREINMIFAFSFIYHVIVQIIL